MCSFRSSVQSVSAYEISWLSPAMFNAAKVFCGEVGERSPTLAFKFRFSVESAEESKARGSISRKFMQIVVLGRPGIESLDIVADAVKEIDKEIGKWKAHHSATT